MATLTLQYNPRNLLAKKTIDYILSLDLFKTDVKYSALKEAELDVKNGRVYKAENGKDLIEKCLKAK
jgi:hypothetical protein